MALFPHIPFAPDETHLSFAARLAAMHINDRVIPFLNDLGIQPTDFARGQRSSVEALCRHANVPAAKVLANTPVAVGKGLYSLRGETISADMMSNPLTKFCPACLRSDDTAGISPSRTRRGRVEWLLRVVRTCPVHGTTLESRPRKAWDDQFHEMTVLVPEQGEDLDALVLAAPRRQVSTLQSYVLARLNEARGPLWLDSQTLEQAVRTTELIGSLIVFGSARKVSKLTSDEWERAGSVGFEFTSRGEPGIREALYRVQDAFRETGKRPLHRNVFGRLYEALCSKKTAKEMGDIKRIVRTHIFETVAVPPGEPVLGECLAERRLHTVASLAREAGLHRKTLGHLLAAKGLVSAENASTVFDAEAGRKVADSVQRLVHVISVPEALNCSRPQAEGLMDERILRQLATGEAGVPGRTQKAVDSHDIQAFLAALGSCACLVELAPAGMAPISKAAEKGRVPCTDIVHLILGGFLSNVVRVGDKEGYAAIHVDVAEVCRAGQEALVGISLSQAAGRMGFPVKSVWSLLDEDEGKVLPSTWIHGLNGKHSFCRLKLGDIDQFRAGYLTPGDIANQLEVPRDQIEMELRRYHIQPVFSKARIGVDLYRLADLPVRLRSNQTRAAS